mgnify:CR=1 FL=1
MKKQLFTAILVAAAIIVCGQNISKTGIKPAPVSNLLLQKTSDNQNNPVKTKTCLDTIRYPQLKEFVLGTENFYTFDAYSSDAESMSQTFLLSGGTMLINGVEFFGRNEPDQATTVVVQASVWNVDASYNPTTQIGSAATLTITDTNYSYRRISFGTPISVSANYAIVIKPTNTDGVVEFYVNDATPSQTYDENLSRYKSSYYSTSNGSWVSIATLSTIFTGGPYDFEMLVAPEISYTITTNFTTTPSTVCLGSPISFANTTTPSGVISSRMFNYETFNTYFLGAADSAYVYYMDDLSSLIWNATTSYTYTSANTYNPRLYTLGGLYNSCLDSTIKTVVIDPCTGIENNDGDASLMIAPNPVNDLLNINYANQATDEVNVSIFSADGRIIYNENNASVPYFKTIDASRFTKGIYFIRMVSGQESITKKIIVQ